MKRHLRAAVLSLPFWGAACFSIPYVTTIVTALAGTVTTGVNVWVVRKSSTSDSRLIQSFDRDAKTTADRLELMIDKVRIETQNDIKQVGWHITKVEERITKVEERITKVEERITKVEERIAKVEDGIKDVKDAVEEVKKLLSKPDEPNVFNFLRR